LVSRLRTADIEVEDILDLINPHYDYKLKADTSIKDISTSDIAKKNYNGINNNLTKILDHEKKIVFVDTNGTSQEQKTYINTGETSIVTQIIGGLPSSMKYGSLNTGP
jgi:hypothetical protein